VDPRESTYYWISGNSVSGSEAKDTDVAALAAGFITITPIQYDLTRYDLMDTLDEIVVGYHNRRTRTAGVFLE
jgi:5'-nucleotidase